MDDCSLLSFPADNTTPTFGWATSLYETADSTNLGVRIILTELREEFWILRARQAIKQVLHSCLPCRIAKGLPGGEIEAPLPTDRVTLLRPFAVTGIDYAGSLFVKVENTLELYCPIHLCDNTSCASGALSVDVNRQITLSTSKGYRKACST